MRRNKRPNEGVFLATTTTTSSPPSGGSSSTVFPSFRSLTYDVFLSFRGKDTRKIFVDHLYTYLVQLGIHTYRDDKTLHKGECIHPSLMKAIAESQIAVIVFSENYGDSSSCLRELEYIMKCKDDGKLIVIPIFYGVIPADVRKQTGKFGKGFAKQVLENSVNIESCRKALEAAGLISGWEPKHMANGHESVVTSEIANTIFHGLRLTSSANEDPVGIDTRMQDFESCLKVGSSDVRMVGIWGLGGGGKTTIASYVYKEISENFEGCSFVRNIREASNKYGLEKLQEKVLFDILKIKVTTWSVEEGMLMIRSRFRHKKVLIVLDDVACHEHLDALAGSHDWFGEGSLIIITTTDIHLLNAHKVDATYNISLLDDKEALQLFHRHTRCSRPDEDHEKLSGLSQNVVSYAKGLPLALKVLGLFLCDKDACEWSSALTRLVDIPGEDFVKRLKISYDSLKPVEQELFLDIACIFRHWPKLDEAMMILDACGFYPVVGVKVLLQKALISIRDGMFDMHDVIQEMGYHIVRGKYTNNPEKLSRVWQYEDIVNMCTSSATLENSKIQVLHSPDRDAPPNLLKVVANMKKLRLINVRQNVKTPVEEPLSLSNGLRWISWEGYPARWLPTNFQPTKLVGLKLKNGLQENLWTEFKYIPSLKVLDLHGSDNLITTPDFGGLPNLETLVLSGCKSLREIHSSIGSHMKLVFLDLDDCKELEVFPPIITMQKLETLVLSGCSQLVNFPDIQHTMDNLKLLNMDYTGINVVPSSITQYCTNLKSVSLIGCTKLDSMHLDLRSLKSIRGQSNGVLSFCVGGAYNIKDLVQEAQIRWLRPGEVLFILQNHEETQLTHVLPQKPPSGSLFLFNKRVLRFFRKDGHNWRRKKDGRTVGEAHERLKVGNVEALNCYYAHGEQNPNFQRRCYWMLDQIMDHIVLVHYRDIGIRMASRHSSGSISTFSSGSSTLTQGSNSNASQFTQSTAAFSQFPELSDSILSSSSTEVSSNVVARSYVAGPLGLTQGFEKIGGSPSSEIDQALRSIKKELDIDEDTLKDISAFDNLNEPDDFKYSEYTPARNLSESYQDFYSTTLESDSCLQEQKFTPSLGHAYARLVIPSSHVPNISKRLVSSSPVASSSPYSQSMPVSSHSRDYDVLLTYRGQDTRRTLVGRLYTALQQQGISTYLDIDDHVSSSEVIEQSEIAVIVFSKNYADSLRCLDQLAYIMKCREERGQTNLSVFYDVDQSEVIDHGRKHKEAFQIRELENEKIVESWRKSLTDAACISGWQVDCQPFDWQESRCIEEIVDTISRKLHPVLSSSSEDLILTETHTQDQKSSSSQSVRAWSSHSWDYDAISFRGGETRVTFEDYPYTAAKQESNYAYKYDAILKHGTSIISLLFNAIEESKIAVIVFSNNDTDAFHDCNIPKNDYKLLLKGYKYLLHLSCIDLSYVHGMVTTPDFGGLPCVQVLKLHHCSSLEDIHSSLGHHASLVYLSVHHCHKLKMIPTITGMKKLKTLEILDCDALHEFPEIHAIIDRHWSIFTADTIAEFSPGLPSWASFYSIPAVYSQWRNHDVFLSFIGEYDSKAFVEHLYSTFIQQGIHVYKPDKAPSLGDSIGMSFKNAIEESQIVIIIFTTNYAGSSRCLDELSYIMKCIDMRGLHVMPIFYDVSSSDVQKQSGAFGKEFDKQELENMAKVESWRKALNGVCKHSGWSLKHIVNRNESRYIKDIVATVSHRLFFLNSKVKKDLIGIGPRLESLTTELAIGSDDVRMVVVGGIGGSGKTTIASCVYMEISRQFEGRCFVENVRDESSKYGIKKLQQKLLSTILKKEVDVRSDEEGKHMIQSMLCHRKVLIVLDDVNDPHQLELLAGSHEWFGEGSRIIITSREGNVLLSKVDILYDVSLLSNDEAINLFRRHAYPEYNLVDRGKWRPSSSFVEAYDMLSQNVISYAYGLPLTLKVLGSFLYDKDKHEWEGTLAKLRDVSNPSTIDKLKISYDGLQPDEKELFLDIACFFRGAFVDSLRTLLDTLSFHPFKRLDVLVNRGLISITNGMFDMHDLIEEMAHHIVREGHPTHPQKHSRVWQWIDVVDICATDTTEEFNKIKALYAPNYDAQSNLLKVVANMKNLQLLSVRQHAKEVVEEPLFLSNELRWISWENYPASSFPTSFQPELLFSLILRNGLQRVLWKGFKRLPRLKVLDLHGSKNLDTTPDFGGLPNLERLVLSGCSSLKEIDRSIGYHERLVYLNLDSCEKLETFPPILWMPKLETIILSRCSSLLKFPEIKRTMNGLKHLYMDYSGIDVLPSTVGRYCINLVIINLIGCDKLERIEGNFQLFKQRCVILVNAHNMKN